MGFIGGDLQERFVERVRGVDSGRLLAVPIDVGKASAAALVCDFWGEVVSPPFTFPLTAPGVEAFTLAVARAEAERDAAWVRAGLETKLGRLLLVEGMDPQRIRRLGPERLRGFCAR